MNKPWRCASSSACRRGSRLACCQSNGARGTCLGSSISTPCVSSACIRAWMGNGSAAGPGWPCLGTHSEDMIQPLHIVILSVNIHVQLDWKAISKTTSGNRTNIATGRPSHSPLDPIKTIHILLYTSWILQVPTGMTLFWTWTPYIFIFIYIYIYMCVCVTTTKVQRSQWNISWVPGVVI